MIPSVFAPTVGRIAIVVSLVASIAVGARPDESATPSFGSHYTSTFGCGGVGVGIGTAFGFLASIGGTDRTMQYALVFGGLGGGLVGVAYGANTATEWQERNGSFGLDLLGALGAGTATILAGYGVSELASDLEIGDQAEGWAGLALFGTVPLGAVLVQRLVAGNPPVLAAWRPRNASPGTIGVVARWSIR